VSLEESRTVYAIVRSGGKQLEAAVGSSVTLDDVLLVGGEGELRVGTPRLENAAVVGTVVEQGRDAKIRVFKFKRRKHYRRTRGHRQAFTAVRIERVES
jgi:large subunit ribosomal protein L21